MPYKIIRSVTEVGSVDVVVRAETVRGIRSFLSERPGSARIFDARRGNARYEIRTFLPVWKGGHNREAELLRRCYTRCLELAMQKKCESIVIPMLAEDDLHFPQTLVYQIAVNFVREFLAEHEVHIYLLISNPSAFRPARPLMQEVREVVTRNFENDWWTDAATTVVLPPQMMYSQLAERREERENRKESQMEMLFQQERREAIDAYAPAKQETTRGQESKGADFTIPPVPFPAPGQEAKPSGWDGTGSLSDWHCLKSILETPAVGFSETLLKLIDQSGKKDSEIYNRANVTRQHFSKIRNNSNYRPTKPTAIAFAIALELDMEETRDLIGRAGYALTESSKFDLIIMYFIRKRYYNMYDINEVLFEFDQSLLGA